MRHSTHRPARRWLAAAGAVALLAASACTTTREGEPTSPVLQSSTVTAAGDVQALRALQQRWQALGLERYQFVLAQSCFCPTDVTQPALVEVRDGVVTRVTARSDGRTLDPQFFVSIEQLFERAIEAAERGEHLEVRHDAQYAYPTELVIGTLANDAGVAYSVSGVRRVE